MNLRFLWGRGSSLQLTRNGSCVKRQKRMEMSEKARMRPKSRNKWIKADPDEAIISRLRQVALEKPPISNPFVMKSRFRG